MRQPLSLSGSFTGSFSGSFSGSLQGTASWATNAVTANNGGVTQITAGTGISRNTSTGNVTITNTGVTSIVAGTAIATDTSTGAVTINNNGVTSLTAGNGISLNTTTGNVTITNTSTYVTPYLYFSATIDDNGSGFSVNTIVNELGAGVIAINKSQPGEYVLASNQSIFDGLTAAINITVGVTSNSFVPIPYYVVNNSNQITIYIYDVLSGGLITNEVFKTTIDIKRKT